jgi:IclR family pca regulon transcriptional regulator
VAGRGTGPDFVEALARGLDVMAALGSPGGSMTLADVANAADLARPTARRLLLTLEELGYVQIRDGVYSLTPRVLRLGMAYVGALGLWDVARPHLEDLVAKTGESSSMAQLDGSDIVYVARVSVPKIIALRVEIGTRFPAGSSLRYVPVGGRSPTKSSRRASVPSRSPFATARAPFARP